jgi:TonB family protein
MLTRFLVRALLLSTVALALGQDAPLTKVAVAPKYPPLAVQGRISGVVVIRTTVGTAGEVTQTEVVSGHPMLKEAAVVAAKNWKFDRASAQARAVTLRFSFVILPEKAESEGETTFLPPDQIEISKRPLPPTVNYEHRGQ